MAKAKQTSNVIPFPVHLTRLPRADADAGRKFKVRTGSIEVYAGDNGMVSIDACVPVAVAARMLAQLSARA
jgi:hypothetical protein